MGYNARRWRAYIPSSLVLSHHERSSAPPCVNFLGDKLQVKVLHAFEGCKGSLIHWGGTVGPGVFQTNNKESERLGLLDVIGLPAQSSPSSRDT